MEYADAIQKMKKLKTNGINFDLDTKDIIAKIEAWNKVLDLEILEVTWNSVTVHFKSLPEDGFAFAQEVYEFCPDTVDQHFGCFDEMIDTLTETGEEIPENIQTLIEGVDLTEEDYGIKLLEKSLRLEGKIQLWWD